MSDACCAPRLTRRSLFASAATATAGLALGMPAFAAPAKRTAYTADQALALLKTGNRSFITDAPFRAATDRKRRIEIAAGQTPFVVLVSCSDSRVSPELLFGRGLGELFIVRNAGNTVDTAALGSIEYGVSVLGVPLVVVMGHEKCGAVDAAVDVVKNGTVYPGSIGAMIEPIIPAVLAARPAQDQGLLDRAIKENVLRTARRLATASEPALTEPLKAGRLKVVGATYALSDGKVSFYDVDGREV
jgi:carbonic anhydrase